MTDVRFAAALILDFDSFVLLEFYNAHWCGIYVDYFDASALGPKNNYTNRAVGQADNLKIKYPSLREEINRYDEKSTVFWYNLYSGRKEKGRTPSLPTHDRVRRLVERRKRCAH